MKRFNIYMPDQVHRDIKEISEAQRRSMNQQVIAILEEYIQSWKAIARKETRREALKMKDDNDS